MSAPECPVVELLLRYLEAEGVEYVFGVPGGPLTAFFEALRKRSRIRYVLACHEGGAALMANSYARTHRSLSVCCVTSGPGATNAVTGVASAWADSLPVLYITGQVGTRAFGKGAIQESTAHGTDVVEMLRPITKLSTTLHSAHSAHQSFQLALRTALSDRWGPVHISLPADVARQPVSSELVAPSRYRAAGTSSVDLSAVDAVARRLVSAKRPTLLVGHGVALAGAAQALRQLAEALHVPVITSPKGKGVFPENHPLSAGVFGFGGHVFAERWLENDDVIVVVGSSLNEFSSNTWDERVNAPCLIQIDVDAIEIGRNYPVDLSIVGDARVVLEALGGRVTEMLVASGATKDPDPLRSLRAEGSRYEYMEKLTADASPIVPQRLMVELRAELPDDGMLFVDNGNCILWGGHYFEVRRPDTYFIDLGLASMGSAVAGVVGGKLGAPDRAAVALVGDAAFAMNGAEVHTAVELGCQVIWIVLNNHGHGMVRQGEQKMLGKDLGYAGWRVPIDAAGWGRAMGARGVRVETPSAFRMALREALLAPGPTVIDAIIDPTVEPPTLARRARSLARFFGLAPNERVGPPGSS